MNNTLNTEKKEYRLWKPITFGEEWATCDTSVLDDISASWFRRRVVLEEGSLEYKQFLEELKREHAIETGVIEGLYDLKKGITETFIKGGFEETYLSYGDTNVAEFDLINYLNTHLEAVEFVFETVKENRKMTALFIKKLHQIVTKHQDYHNVINQFGDKVKVELKHGVYKEYENNPTSNGVKILYCPPKLVSSEIDKLINTYNKLLKQEKHPLIIASWLHHAFTLIHPFQDGNGRVARLLASLVLIKFNLFPLTVLRQERRVKYLNALEKADKGQPQKLVEYFGEIQKRNIEKALHLKEMSSDSLDEMQKFFVQRVKNWAKNGMKNNDETLEANKIIIYNYCKSILQTHISLLDNKNNDIKLSLSDAIDTGSNHIIEYSKKYKYHYDRLLSKIALYLEVNILPKVKYIINIELHHFGFDGNTIAIAPFFISDINTFSNVNQLNIPPHVISLMGDMNNKKKNIEKYLEKAILAALAEIASRMTK